MRPSTWSCGVVSAVVSLIVLSMYDVCTSRSLNCDSNLSITMDICSVSQLRPLVTAGRALLGLAGAESSLRSQGRPPRRGALLTRSRFMLSIALSMPLTTEPIELVTVRMVTAVSTRDATASMRDARRSRLSASVFLRIAFCA